MGLTWIVLVVGRGALGVRSVPLGLLAGEVLAVAILASITRRRLGAPLRPTLARTEPVRRIFRLTRLEVAGSLITRVNPLIDQLMAGLTGVVGGGTLVRYAADVASLPTSILQATLFPVLLRRLALESREPARFLTTTRRTVGAVVAALAVFALAFALVRAPLCRLLFLRGAMDPAGVARIASILPWALAGRARRSALSSSWRGRTWRGKTAASCPGWASSTRASTSASTRLLGGLLGLSSLALSTSITYAVVALVFRVRQPRDAPAWSRGAREAYTGPAPWLFKKWLPRPVSELTKSVSKSSGTKPCSGPTDAASARAPTGHARRVAHEVDLESILQHHEAMQGRRDGDRREPRTSTPRGPHRGARLFVAGERLPQSESAAACCSSADGVQRAW